VVVVGGGVGWPSVRVGNEHVGSVMLDGKERQVDVNILLAATPPAQCQRNLSEERLAELRAIVEADGLHGVLAGKANSAAPSPAPTAVTAPNATAHTSAPSLAPSPPTDNLKVISYGVWGADPRYLNGIQANAKLMLQLYPGWMMWVYHDSSVPAAELQWLRSKAWVRLVDMTGSRLRNKMSWRFLPAADPKVERFCSRDVDSRLSWRERLAVAEWEESGMRFHSMRDHPSHSKFAMSGGMWCATREAVPDMEALLMKASKPERYMEDMNFLTQVRWLTSVIVGFSWLAAICILNVVPCCACRAR